MCIFEELDTVTEMVVVKPARGVCRGLVYADSGRGLLSNDKVPLGRRSTQVTGREGENHQVRGERGAICGQVTSGVLRPGVSV